MATRTLLELGTVGPRAHGRTSCAGQRNGVLSAMRQQLGGHVEKPAG
jgi:hypothetical protein